MANEFQKLYGYIYCTTDLKNGMKYIGQKKSNKFLSYYYGSGKIIKSKIKSRPETFRVDLVEWCYSKEELNKYEDDWINAIGLYPLSYNLVQGGGTTTGYRHNEKAKQKMSENHKGQIPWNKGIKQTEEHKRKIGEANKGRICSTEIKLKISEANKGRLPPITGKHHSEETRQKMSKLKKGKPLSEKNRMALKGIKKKPFSEEHRKKLSETTSNYWKIKKELTA
ncbi:MAG: hypothetical protein LBC17_02135 [Lactobacillaceae bacterium]|jgi:group I intron endonuclease|nr:hypothetical protein [Lactobacillaceae bacterium]